MSSGSASWRLLRYTAGCLCGYNGRPRNSCLDIFTGKRAPGLLFQNPAIRSSTLQNDTPRLCRLANTPHSPAPIPNLAAAQSARSSSQSRCRGAPTGMQAK